jgi:hypothetical protein
VGRGISRDIRTIMNESGLQPLPGNGTYHPDQQGLKPNLAESLVVAGEAATHKTISPKLDSRYAKTA